MVIGSLITHRERIMHRLISDGWHLLNIQQGDVDDVFQWCEDHIGELPELAKLSTENLPPRWFMSTVRTSPSEHWFVMFKTKEDVMWFRMNWESSLIVVDALPYAPYTR